jgi:arsenate reductase (glutaredoxin)
MPKEVQIFGLPNCDATTATTKWLKAKGYTVTLHNYKTDGININKLKEWCATLGWQKILNKRSTTWRSLTPKQQDTVVDEQTAIEIILANTSLIKRPVIEFENIILIGFDEKVMAKTLE